jgi:hypothetical protein
MGQDLLAASISAFRSRLLGLGSGGSSRGINVVIYLAIFIYLDFLTNVQAKQSQFKNALSYSLTHF